MQGTVTRERVRWVASGYRDSEVNFEEDDTNSKQSITITDCIDTIVNIRGALGQVVVENCQGVGLVVESLGSGVVVINSKRIEVQANGTVCSVEVENSDNVRLYVLGEKPATIFTSRSSEVILIIPNSESNGQSEVTLPERIVHKINPSTKKIESTIANDF